jgi:hypothetical protein
MLRGLKGEEGRKMDEAPWREEGSRVSERGGGVIGTGCSHRGEEIRWRCPARASFFYLTYF